MRVSKSQETVCLATSNLTIKTVTLFSFCFTSARDQQKQLLLSSTEGRQALSLLPDRCQSFTLTRKHCSDNRTLLCTSLLLLQQNVSKGMSRHSYWEAGGRVCNKIQSLASTVLIQLSEWGENAEHAGLCQQHGCRHSKKIQGLA